MSRPAISSEKLSDTLTLSLCHADSEHRIEPNYWLYDNLRWMNIAIGAPSKEAALLQALEYYQKRLLETEKKYHSLDTKVSSFIEQLEGGQA